MLTTNDNEPKLIHFARMSEAASGDTTDHKEAEAQYAILDDFLSK